MKRNLLLVSVGIFAVTFFLASTVCASTLSQPPDSDFDNDGKTDMLWKNENDGQVVLWIIENGKIEQNKHVDFVSNIDWQIVSNGDFSGDGNADILWRNSATGQVVLWTMVDGARTANSIVDTVSDLRWRIVATGDFNKDAKADILWQHSSSGQIALWLMNGPVKTLNIHVGTVGNKNWRIASSADFDGDQDMDILWRNQSSGQVVMWLMEGATLQANLNVGFVTDSRWQIAGHGDFNGDLKSDLIWRQEGTGSNAVWLMNGATINANLALPTVSDPDWRLVQAGDFNGDNDSDIAWRRDSNGQVAIWLMSGTSISSGVYASTGGSQNWESMPGLFRGVSGLASRPSNTTCIAPDAPTVNASVATAQVFGGIGVLTRPLAMLQAPGDSSQWYVVEKRGRVLRFSNDPAVTNSNVFIDLQSTVDSSYTESGLLGMAFHPDYENNRYVYLSYTATGPDSVYLLTSRLSRFESNDGGLTLDPASEVILLSHDQPYTNHNGGHIGFGPDGYLYYGLGDGGSAGDPQNRAQNTSNLFGSLVRIDVDSGTPYGIPATNPFVGNTYCTNSVMGSNSAGACPEIFAWGLRNPWRWSFDAMNGDLWLGDVGQYEREEVDLIRPGGNYGWHVQEGLACFNPATNCDKTGLVQPVLDYDHTVGATVTGGFVYRGTNIPELFGRYVFADYVAGKLFATVDEGNGQVGYEELLDTNFLIATFGQGEDGELYFVDYGGGTMYEIIQAGGTSIDTISPTLAGTGCADPNNPTFPSSGVIPYSTNVSFWSDGAVKSRHLAIPDGSTIDIDISGDFKFPVGTVLVKDFRLNGDLIETRQMVRHSNGSWAGYTYEWNDDESSATRVVGGKTKVVNGQSWTYPSETQCMMCHTSAAGFALGPEIAQLNRDFAFPGTGITANLLSTYEAENILTDPLQGSPDQLSTLLGNAAGGMTLDFNYALTESYPGQDEHSNVSVLDNGLTILLADNTHRQTIQTFSISPSTVLEFDFESTEEAEVHGIGFDENGDVNDAPRIFQVFGFQNWPGSIHDFDDYSISGPKHYEIPVGQYYSGSSMRLVFVNDLDAGDGLGGNSYFSNVRIRDAMQSGQPPSSEDQVRAYLHTNCSICHRPLGPTPSNMDLRFDVTWSSMNVCDVVPSFGSLGVSDPKIIAPGDSSRSILIDRMNRRDVYAMPPIGSHLVDQVGVQMIANWIDSLSACP